MEERKPMSADEIQREIEHLARHGDGAEKRWALNKLDQKYHGETFGQPNPMAEVEIIDRMRVLMRAAGKETTQIAYHREFNVLGLRKHRVENINPAKFVNADNVQIDPDKLPRTRRQLFRMFPELKQGGTPRGFPSKGGPMAQEAWCKNRAIARIVEIEQEKVRQAAMKAQEEEAKDAARQAEE